MGGRTPVKAGKLYWSRSISSWLAVGGLQGPTCVIVARPGPPSPTSEIQVAHGFVTKCKLLSPINHTPLGLTANFQLKENQKVIVFQSIHNVTFKEVAIWGTVYWKAIWTLSWSLKKIKKVYVEGWGKKKEIAWIHSSNSATQNYSGHRPSFLWRARTCRPVLSNITATIWNVVNPI